MRKYLLLATLLLSACSSLSVNKEEGWQSHWEKIEAQELPSLTPDGDLKAFRLALERQNENCDAAKTGMFHHCGSESSPAGLICEKGVISKLLEILEKNKNWEAFFREAKTTFDWYRYKAGSDRVRFTAYDSPLFHGDIKPGPRFKYPVYARPADLVVAKGDKGETLWRKKLPDGSLVPYDDRKAIEISHSLAGQGLELAYFDSPTDVLRLQIEGSGVLELPNGKQRGLNYAAKNGFPYISIFKTMKEKGINKKYLTFPGLKQFFLDHPKEFWPILTQSPSYVFFTLTDEPPCGTARVHVTGGHSIAVDPSQMPLGLVAFFSAERPVDGTDPEAKAIPMKPFSRFAVAQDTGGAILGAHVDVYWGTGPYAHLASNSMNSKGDLYTLRLKKPPAGSR